MIDPGILVLLLLGGALVLRDYGSINNLKKLFDAADDVLGQPEDAARIADDIASMSRTVLNPRRSRQMALMAIRGQLSSQLRMPGPKVVAFSRRWDSARYADRRAELLRRFVWELTRASLGFGAVFGVWLLWRRAQFWDEAAPEWAVLAALGLGMRAGDGP
jgi:hypothetical protein